MANKRLIDANVVEAKIEKNFRKLIANQKSPDLAAALSYVGDLIIEAPTEDAVEVVHANWDNNGICTMCGYPIPTDSKYDFIDKDDCLFCYHCGAKMDGDRNG